MHTYYLFFSQGSHTDLHCKKKYGLSISPKIYPYVLDEMFNSFLLSNVKYKRLKEAGLSYSL